METTTEIKVTKIGPRWHAGLFYKGKVHSEMACEVRQDIGYICRQLARWFDKCGGDCVAADATRTRLNRKETNYQGPVGKVWYSSYYLKTRTKKEMT